MGRWRAFRRFQKKVRGVRRTKRRNAVSLCFLQVHIQSPWLWYPCLTLWQRLQEGHHWADHGGRRCRQVTFLLERVEVVENAWVLNTMQNCFVNSYFSFSFILFVCFVKETANNNYLNNWEKSSKGNRTMTYSRSFLITLYLLRIFHIAVYRQGSVLPSEVPLLQLSAVVAILL